MTEISLADCCIYLMKRINKKKIIEKLKERKPKTRVYITSDEFDVGR